MKKVAYDAYLEGIDKGYKMLSVVYDEFLESLNKTDKEHTAILAIRCAKLLLKEHMIYTANKVLCLAVDKTLKAETKRALADMLYETVSIYEELFYGAPTIHNMRDYVQDSELEELKGNVKEATGKLND